MNEDPRGNLRLLAQRLAELYGPRACGEGWERVRPFALAAIESLPQRVNLGPLGSLGDVTDWLKYVLWPVNAVGMDLAEASYSKSLDWTHNAIQNAVDPGYQEYKASLPAPPPLAPPSAPQTVDELRGNWTLEQAASGSVAASKDQQQSFFNDLGARLAAAGQTGETDNTWVWVAAAVAALALLYLLTRNHK